MIADAATPQQSAAIQPKTRSKKRPKIAARRKQFSGKRRSIHDWDTLCKAFAASDDDLKEFARSFKISYSSISKIAAEQDWQAVRRKAKTMANDACSNVAAGIAAGTSLAAIREQQNLAMSAQTLVDRQIRVSGALLGQAERLTAGSLDPKAFQAVASATKTSVDIGRSAFRLDEKQEQQNPLAGGLGSIRIEVSAGGQVNVSGGAPECYLPVPAARQIESGLTPAVDAESAKVPAEVPIAPPNPPTEPPEAK